MTTMRFLGATALAALLLAAPASADPTPMPGTKAQGSRSAAEVQKRKESSRLYVR